MKDLNINEQLLKEDLFLYFKEQLRKDFESSAIDVKFTDALAHDFEQLKKQLITVLLPLINQNSALIPTLLYRVDISESLLFKKQKENLEIGFEEILAELIIKRVLQKVVLKRKFSNK